MSEQRRTPEEYLERYAAQRCKGDKEEAKNHAIVKEVTKSLEEK